MNNEHVTAWLGAYYDGELRGFRLQKVEAHLAHCETCRVELEELQALTALLQESPVAEGLTQPDRFAAQVGLRLPRRPRRPTWQRALETGWRLVPVGLLGAWVFVQAALLTSSAVMGALRLGIGSDVAAQLLPASRQGSWLANTLSLSSVNLGDLWQIAPQLLNNGGPLGWGITLNLVALAVIGLLYLSWLASWWARRHHINGEVG
jgi:anti-sigma factor RsiW